MNAFQDFEFDDIIRIAIAVVVIFATLISILYVIWGGFLMIVSGGKEEKIKPAVNFIRHAAIGIVFLFGVLYVFPILMNLLGIPYGEYAKPSAVFATISEISDLIFNSNLGTPSIIPSDVELPKDFSTGF